MNLETLIFIGYCVSSLGFLVAAIVTSLTVSKLGKSALGSVVTYLFMGTATFFVITIFQYLGAHFFNISDESMDIWWHIMFYLALTSYFLGFKALVSLTSQTGQSGALGKEKWWGIFSFVLLAIIFIIPSYSEPTIMMYNASSLSAFGLHHFIAFALAGLVGFYVLFIKKNIGQIGHAIANPVIVALSALSLQHFWELLAESWKVIDLPSEKIEGGEKIFLTIAAFSITYAIIRLKSLTAAK